MLRRKPLTRIGAEVSGVLATPEQRWAFATVIFLIACTAIAALFLAVFYNPPAAPAAGGGGGGGGANVTNFTCTNVTSCLENGNLTLNSLTVNDLTVVNMTSELEANSILLNGSLTCTTHGQIDGDCIDGGYISTINTINPYLPSRDFTIIGGPGIAISGGTNSLTIRNNINLTLTGQFFIVKVLFGNITITVVNQTANYVFAGPTSGPPGPPTFRPLIAQDLPLIPLNASHVTGVLPVSLGGTGTSIPLNLGQLFTGDGMGNLIPTNIVGGYDVYVTTLPNGTIVVNVEKAVHSVGLTVPEDIFNATVALVEEHGNLTFVVLPQVGNRVWASPDGTSGVPTFRALVEQDLPSISLASKVYGVLPIANGGTNSGTALNNHCLMQSLAGQIVEAPMLLDGQIFIGSTSVSPVPAVPTGSGGISVAPGPGTLDISMTSAPTFATLNVNGTTTLGTYTTCATALQPSCLDISNQACPGGVLSTNCIPTSGLYFTDLVVGNLTILNQTNQINVDVINGTNVNVNNLFVENIALNQSMTCVGNASISPSCIDISQKQCPGGALSESCIPTSLVLANLQVTSNLTVSGMHCVGGMIDDNCVMNRFKSINGLYANQTNKDFTIVAGDAGISIQPAGLHGISIGNTLVTTNQISNVVYAGPASAGPAAPPTFRSLVTLDLPHLPLGQVYVGQGAGTPVIGKLLNTSLSLPVSVFNVTVPLVGDGESGTLTAVFVDQAANLVFAGPASAGPAGIPSFRALNYSDLPPLIMSVGFTVPSAEFAISNSPLKAPGGTLVLQKQPQAGNTFWAGAANGTNGLEPEFRTLVAKDFTSLNLTLGQFLAGINASGGDPVPTDILAGTGIVLTKVDGSITISASINASNIGTVTSVGLALPNSVFDVTNSPVTVSGTLTGSFVNQSGSTVFASPLGGGSGQPAFRSLATSDLPQLSGNQIFIGNATTNTTSISTLVAGNAISIVTAPSSGGGGYETTISSTMSVGLSLPASVFNVTNSPVTSNGTLTGTFNTQPARTFFAAPALTAGIPSFRFIQATDLPTLMSGQLFIGNAGTAVASSLSAGSGITITPGPGTLTVSANYVEPVGNGTLVIGSSSGPAAVATLTGTVNQVNVLNGANSITLSTPQDIHTGATPTFLRETLTATTNQLTFGGTPNTVTLNVAAPSAPRIITVPDPGANANVVLDTAGPLTITNTPVSVGQVLTSVSGTTAIWQNQMAFNGTFTYQEVTSTTAILSYSSSTFTVSTGMTFVLPAGVWQVSFSTSIVPSASSGLYQVQFFNGATGIIHSLRRTTGASGQWNVATQAVMVSDGVNAITVQWRKSGGSGTADMFERSMFALRLA